MAMLTTDDLHGDDELDDIGPVLQRRPGFPLLLTVG